MPRHDDLEFLQKGRSNLEALDKLFNDELPKWWLEQKTKLADKPEAGGEKIKTEPSDE